MRFPSVSRFLPAAAAVLGLAAVGAAQTAPSRDLELAWDWDSGPIAAAGAEQVGASETVHVRGATSLRLVFDEVRLAPGSRLRITSHADGAVQELDRSSAAQWASTSAYFNGDAVQLELVAAPGTRDNRVRLGRVAAALSDGTLPTICGATDDRSPSADPAIARVVPVGCTAWLLDDCQHCLVTAGHCFYYAVGPQVVEFDVPPSLSDGTLVHPPPQEQYAIDPASIQQQFTFVLGEDWGYFGCFPNAVTGLTPFEAQGRALALAPPPAAPAGLSARVAGYGTTTPADARNQTQQEHVGPFTTHFGDVLRYAVDTTGGSSGSPVVLEPDGTVVAIHTNGGCSAVGGANAGTAVDQAPFASAVASPRGVCAAPPVVTYCQGKVNSLGCPPALSSSGAPSASSSQPFTIRADDLVPGEAGFLIYGTGGRANLAFHNGRLCVKAPLTRLLPPRVATPDGTDPCAGRIEIDFNARIRSGADPLLVPGTRVNAQLRQRDPGLGDGYGDTLTDGIEFVVCP